MADRSEKLQQVRDYCARPGTAVLFDEPGGLLYDSPTGKTLAMSGGELERVEAKENAETHQPYLALLFSNGRAIALTEAGIAFAPDLRNTGPGVELPQAVCWRDFQNLKERLKHDLYGHPDRPPTRQTLGLLLMCIAIIDGARAQGFEVGREEQELETHLRELEQRGPPPA